MARLHLATVLLAGVTLGGCGEPPLTLDEETVQERITWAEQVPLCNGTARRSTEALRSVTPELTALYQKLQALKRSATHRRMATLLPAGMGSSGSCGGTLDVEWEHLNGDNDYVVDFNDYCLTSSEGNVVINGRVKSKEDGTPSPSGPVIEAFTLDTAGPVELTMGGETITLEVNNVRTEFGVPETYAPGMPTATSPDVTTMGGLTAEFSTDGREDFVDNLSWERSGGLQATVNITDGTWGTRGHGSVEIRTSPTSPLVVNLAGPTFVSGGVELTGADDTLVVLTSPSAGVFDINLNGMPYPESMDCAPAMEPFTEGALAVLLALPLH